MITGKVIIIIDPKGSKIYINSELKGVSPLVLTLPIGKYKGEAKKEGCVSMEWGVVAKESFPPNEYVFALRCSPEVYKRLKTK